MQNQILKNWQKIKLGELISVRHGYAFKGEYFTDDANYLLLTPGNFYEDGGLKLNDNDTYYGGNIPSEYILKKGDLIVAMTDLKQTAPILGSAAFIDKDNFFLHNQRLGKIKIKNEEKLDIKYCYFLFNSYFIREFIKSTASGATVKHTSPNRIYQATVIIPEINTQKKTAVILDSLELLISINKRGIELLEEMAQLLYREWFVEFRFPGYEEVKFVDFELGKIPAEWKISNLNNVGFLKKTPVGINEFDGEKSYYQTSEIEGSSITGESQMVTYNNRPSRADVEPRLNAVYMARMKNTDKVLCFREVNKEAISKILLSTGMFGYETEEDYFGYLYFLLKSYLFLSNKNLYATGATQVSLNDESLRKIKLIFPDENLIKEFSQITNSLLDQILILLAENEILASMRDLLLPKLMSGEIDVSRIDIPIEN